MLRAPDSFVAFMDREVAKTYGSFAKFLEHYGSAESYLGVLDDAGADYGVILAELAPITSAIASNETVEALCQGQPRLIPFASLNPYLIENPARELERLVRERGFRGLKLYPTYSYFYANDPKLYPVYARAQELGIPVKWHTGTSVFPASRLKYGDPVHIDDVAVDFPDLVAIITHSGRPIWYETAYTRCSSAPAGRARDDADPRRQCRAPPEALLTVLIDCHVHLLPRRRLAGLMKWMHGFYPEHPIPRDVTLEQCIACYDTIPVDYIFNLVYPIRADDTEAVNSSTSSPTSATRGSSRSAGSTSVVFHTGYEEFYGLSLPPTTMEELARLFPNLPVVFAHLLFPRFDDAWRIVERYDNVWLEMTNVFSSFWDRRYVLKEYDTEKRLLLEGSDPTASGSCSAPTTRPASAPWRRSTGRWTRPAWGSWYASDWSAAPRSASSGASGPTSTGAARRKPEATRARSRRTSSGPSR